MNRTIDMVHVFTLDGTGGNPCPVICEADGMNDAAMQAVARDHGHESGFISAAPDADHDYAFRFWVPNHEMAMCGHATIGAIWLLASKGLTDATQLRIATRSGPVTGYVTRGDDGTPRVEITQPAGVVHDLGTEAADAVLKVMGLTRDDVLDLPVQNAATSRVKTLVPLRDVERLNSLDIDYASVEGLCSAIRSTGLYPYAVRDAAAQEFEARQFPQNAGYPEDAATGIAATALSFGLLRNDLLTNAANQPIRIMQGRTMGHLSQLNTRLGFAGDRAIGCLVGGAVTAG